MFLQLSLVLWFFFLFPNYTFYLCVICAITYSLFCNSSSYIIYPFSRSYQIFESKTTTIYIKKVSKQTKTNQEEKSENWPGLKRESTARYQLFVRLYCDNARCFIKSGRSSWCIHISLWRNIFMTYHRKCNKTRTETATTLLSHGDGEQNKRSPNSKQGHLNDECGSWMRKRDWSSYVPISTWSVGDSANVFAFVFLYVCFNPTMFYFPFVFQSQISYLPQFPVPVQTFWPFDPVQLEWYIQTEMVPTPTICTAVGAYLPIPTWN